MGWFSEPMVFVLDQAYFSGSSKKTRTFLGQTSTSEDVCVCVSWMVLNLISVCWFHHYCLSICLFVQLQV